MSESVREAAKKFIDRAANEIKELTDGQYDLEGYPETKALRASLADKQEPVGYFQCDKDGNPIWDEGCVCQDPVYPVESDSEDTSRPFYFGTSPQASVSEAPTRKLTDDEIADLVDKCNTGYELCRAIEAKLGEKG